MSAKANATAVSARTLGNAKQEQMARIKPATPLQCEAICAAQAKILKLRLFWIGEQRAKVYRKGREIGELLCHRPFFPVASKGGAYRDVISDLREAITSQIWNDFPAERA